MKTKHLLDQYANAKIEAYRLAVRVKELEEDKEDMRRQIEFNEAVNGDLIDKVDSLKADQRTTREIFDTVRRACKVKDYDAIHTILGANSEG